MSTEAEASFRMDGSLRTDEFLMAEAPLRTEAVMTRVAEESTVFDLLISEVEDGEDVAEREAYEMYDGGVEAAKGVVSEEDAEDASECSEAFSSSHMPVCDEGASAPPALIETWSSYAAQNSGSTSSTSSPSVIVGCEHERKGGRAGRRRGTKRMRVSLASDSRSSILCPSLSVPRPPLTWLSERRKWKVGREERDALRRKFILEESGHCLGVEWTSL